MSNRRRLPCYTSKQPLGTNGKPACLECTGDITDPRRSTFCGKQCSDSFYLKSRPDFARLKVFERDRGICALCCVDVFAGRPEAWKRSRGTGHLWQADHVQPVVEGGGLCGLDNYRTLCTVCHKAETAALRKRMVDARRQALTDKTETAQSSRPASS